MGIKDMIRNLGRGDDRLRCTVQQDGTVKCNLTREHKDGTAVDLAGFLATNDANCNIVLTESYENEEGALDRLEKKALPRIKGKCAGTVPQDY